MKNVHSTSDLIRIGERVSIRRRGAGGIYSAEFWHYGQHRRRSLKIANKSIATQRAIKLETELMGGEYAAPAKPVAIAAAVTEYLEAKRGEGRKPKTLVKYKEWLESFTEFARSRGEHTLRQVNSRLFEEYRNHRQPDQSPKSMYTGLTIIKQLIKWCSGGARDYLPRNPLIGCKMSLPSVTPQFTPSLEQVQAILARATGDRKLQFAVLAMTGLRAQELQMLRPCDVDLARGWIHVVGRKGWAPKTSDARKIPIHAKLGTMLADISKAPRSYFFCALPSPKYPTGNHEINTKHMNEDLQKLAKELGIVTGRKQTGLVVHSLRHFFETQCVDSGVPQFAVDAWMGHASHSAMGRRYYGQNDAKSVEQMNQVQF